MKDIHKHTMCSSFIAALGGVLIFFSSLCIARETKFRKHKNGAMDCCNEKHYSKGNTGDDCILVLFLVILCLACVHEGTLVRIVLLTPFIKLKDKLI